jgi:hypothetical protein
MTIDAKHLPKPIVVDRRRFDADPDRDPNFHFDAESRSGSVGIKMMPKNMRILPLSSTHVGKLGNIFLKYFYSHLRQFTRFFFSNQRQLCHDFGYFLTTFHEKNTCALN